MFPRVFPEFLSKLFHFSKKSRIPWLFPDLSDTLFLIAPENIELYLLIIHCTKITAQSAISNQFSHALDASI